jgi:NMD protein affecting ribosome stability and mRNA decay
MTSVCPQCSAVRVQGHWSYDDRVLAATLKSGDFESVLCPGCERLAKHRVDGVVTLRSPLLDEHREEALNLIHNVAQKRLAHSVAARIAQIEEGPGEIRVATTEQHLAERIGKEFEKAYSGDLEIQWPKGEEFVRVTWARG